MGSNVMLYLTDEVKSILDKRKEKDPDFNLSAFVQSKLLATDIKKQDPEELKLILAGKHATIQREKEEIEIIESQLARIEAELKVKKEREEQDKAKQKDKKAEYLKSFVENSKYYYEISDNDAEIIAEEMWAIPKGERNGLLDELKLRGFKLKKDGD